MDKIIITCILLLFCTLSKGQNVSINDSGTPPDQSALLDLSSQNKGFLLPRMNSLERISITSPQTGLLVYDLDLQSLFYFDGGQWVEFASSRKGLRDNDFDTKILVEQTMDDDTIRLISKGLEKLKIHNGGLSYSSVDSNLYIGNGFREIGENNTSIGHLAGNNLISTSTSNVAIGNRSLHLMDDFISNNNTAIGYSAGAFIHEALDNVFIGNKAFNGNAGSYNVSIGSGSGNIHPNNGSSNVFIGAFSGSSSNQNYSDNVIIGSFAGKVDEGGSKNISIGRGAGVSTSAFPVIGNISIGYNAGNSGILGQDNSIFIGESAGNSMLSCTDCILIGNNSGIANSSLNDVLYIDNESTSEPLIYGRFSSNRLGLNGNVGIHTNSPLSEMHVIHGNNGDESGLRLENESNGNYWRFYVRSANGNLRLYNTEGESNACGNNSGSDDYVAWVSSCSGDWNSTGDRRKKKSFEALENVLPSLMKMEVLTYHFLSESNTDEKHIGLIAQDVEPYFPELIDYDVEADLYTMNYNGFGPIAIKAVQELKLENIALRKELQMQGDKIKDMNAKLDNLIALLASE